MASQIQARETGHLKFSPNQPQISQATCREVQAVYPHTYSGEGYSQALHPYMGLA